MNEKGRKSTNMVDEEIPTRWIEEMPGKPFQSKLLPYAEEIHGLRTRRKTWREIVAILKDRHGVETNLSAVYEFALRNKRKPAPADLLPPAATVADPIKTAQEAAAVLAGRVAPAPASQGEQPTEPAPTSFPTVEPPGEETPEETIARERAERQARDKAERLKMLKPFKYE